MDKLRIDFFDILGYLVLGSALLMLMWVTIDSNVESIWQIYESIHKVDKKSMFVGILIAYIAGFTLHALGSLMYNIYKYGFKKAKSSENPTTQEKWAIIREHGGNHIPILERWYALRALAQNLSAVAFIGIFASFFKWHTSKSCEWGYFALCHLLLAIILLRRSEIFHDNLKKDLDATLKYLEKN